MKINSNTPPEGHDVNRVVQNAAKNVGKTDPKENVGAVQAKPKADTVDISKTGREVSELMAAINEMPGVREEKIKAIQGALEAGTYNLDPGKIAEKILKEI